MKLKREDWCNSNAVPPLYRGGILRIPLFLTRNGKEKRLLILSQETCHKEEHVNPTGDRRVLRDEVSTFSC